MKRFDEFYGEYESFSRMIHRRASVHRGARAMRSEKQKGQRYSGRSAAAFAVPRGLEVQQVLNNIAQSI